MRTYLDCIPCFFNQALRAGRMAGFDEKKLKNLLDEVGTVMKGVSADFIISKGQGNYEGLSEEDRLIFFMLKLKCFVIAEDIGVSEGDIVLKGINI